MKAHTYRTDESGEFTTGDIPEELQERAAAEREKLVELVAEMDDAVDTLHRVMREERWDRPEFRRRSRVT